MNDPYLLDDESHACSLVLLKHVYSLPTIPSCRKWPPRITITPSLVPTITFCRRLCWRLQPVYGSVIKGPLSQWQFGTYILGNEVQSFETNYRIIE